MSSRRPPCTRSASASRSETCSCIRLVRACRAREHPSPMPSPRSGSIRRWSDRDYLVTTDPARVDLDVVHRFLWDESYWVIGRSREQQARANEMSTCFTVLHEPTGAPVGFARVLTDD